MAMKKEERERLKLDIQEENILLQRVKRYVQVGGAIVLLSAGILFFYIKDNRGILFVLDLIVLVISALFTIAAFISYNRGRKHLLGRINYLDEKK